MLLQLTLAVLYYFTITAIILLILTIISLYGYFFILKRRINRSYQQSIQNRLLEGPQPKLSIAFFHPYW